jgi:hypothetical protein
LHQKKRLIGFIEKLETLGLKSLQRFLVEIGGWPLLNPENWSEPSFDLIDSIAKIMRSGSNGGILNAFIWRDIKNSSRNVIFVRELILYFLHYSPPTQAK